MSKTLTLYDNAFSPYAFKVRATLYEKGIEHEKCEMRYGRQREDLLRVNPRGEIPAIVYGDESIYDSAVICEYLEAVFPEPRLVPVSPEDQARCRLLERMSDGPIDGCVIALAVLKVFHPRMETSHPEVARSTREHLGQLYQRLDGELEGREYLCGEFSRADIALAPHVAGARFLGVPPEGNRLAAWYERVSTRPSIRRATAELMDAFRASREDADPFFSREKLHMRDHRLEWCFRVGLGPWLVEEMKANRIAFSPVG